MTTLKDVMSRVAAEMVGALAAAGRPPIERHYGAVGQVAWDSPCGQLTAAPERTFFYLAFPTEFSEASNCDDAAEIAVVTVIRLLRCVPTVDSAGNPPKEDALSDAYDAIMDDASVILNALKDPDWCEWWERAGITQQYLGDLGGTVECETRFTLGTGLTRWGS